MILLGTLSSSFNFSELNTPNPPKLLIFSGYIISPESRTFNIYLCLYKFSHQDKMLQYIIQRPWLSLGEINKCIITLCRISQNSQTLSLTKMFLSGISFSIWTNVVLQQQVQSRSAKFIHIFRYRKTMLCYSGIARGDNGGSLLQPPGGTFRGQQNSTYT